MLHEIKMSIKGTVSCVIIVRDHIPYDTYCLALGLSWCTLVSSVHVQPYLYLSKVGNASKAINLNYVEMSIFVLYVSCD